MNKTIGFIVFFMFLLLCCSREKRGVDVFLWPSTGVEEADSLVPKLQNAFEGGADDDSVSSLLQKLSEIHSRNEGNPRLGALKSYWEARFLSRSGERSRANEILIKAMQELDSAAHTYHYYKLRSQLERTTPSLHRRFRLGAENTAYFSSIGDSLSVAHSLLTTANLLRLIGETSKAESEFRRASAIWREAGLERNYANNQINIALCLDGESADSLYAVLIESPVIKADTAAYTLLLRNMATQADERGKTEEALRLSEYGLALIGESDRYEANAAVLHSIRGLSLLNTGNLEEAKEEARLALGMSDSPLEKYAEYDVLLKAAQIYRECGVQDTALLLLDKALLTRTDDDFELNNITLSIEESRQEMMQMEYQSELVNVRHLLWLSVIVALLLVMAGVALVLHRQVKMRRMKEEMAMAQLEDSRSRLARETLMYEQNESLIDSLKTEIESLRDGGEVAPKVASQLLSVLRMQIADRSERQTFLDVHNHMLPGFSARLKADFPDLTEHQIKLSAYISAGMSNALIAKLLNITPASVRTLRYRIRSKFGLRREDSLEEFLRRYTS